MVDLDESFSDIARRATPKNPAYEAMDNLRMKFKLRRSTNMLEAGVDYRPVFFKTDGSRFDLETTLKLNVNTSYQMTMIFRPVVQINRFEVMGAQQIPSETARDHESITYTVIFDTKSHAVSKKGKRDKIHFSLDLDSYGILNYDIQSKYYAENDKNHVCWGNPLHQIEIESNCSDGEVKVRKCTFR